MSAARSTSSRWSTKKAMWWSRPRVRVRSRVYVRSYDFWLEVEPDARLGAVVEHDLLGQPQAEVLLDEGAVLGGLDGEEVDVVEVADSDAAPRVALRLVLERRPKLRGRLVALGLVEELEPVAVGIEEAVGAAVAEVAVEPAALDSGRLERRDPALESLRAVRAVGQVPDPGLRGRGQLQRRPLVVAEAAQVHRVSRSPGDLHAEDLPEVDEALVRPRRQQLDVREVREVTDRLRHERYPCGVRVEVGGQAVRERHDREGRVDGERPRDERAVPDVEPLDVPGLPVRVDDRPLRVAAHAARPLHVGADQTGPLDARGAGRPEHVAGEVERGARCARARRP